MHTTWKTSVSRQWTETNGIDGMFQSLEALISLKYRYRVSLINNKMKDIGHFLTLYYTDD